MLLIYFAKNEYHESFYETFYAKKKEIFYAPIEVIWFFSFNLLIVLNRLWKKISNKTLYPKLLFIFMRVKKKRPFYDSENILYFNTIAASNILVPERQKKIQAFYNKLSFAFQVILKKILQFCSTL